MSFFGETQPRASEGPDTETDPKKIIDKLRNEYAYLNRMELLNVRSLFPGFLL